MHMNQSPPPVLPPRQNSLSDNSIIEAAAKEISQLLTSAVSLANSAVFNDNSNNTYNALFFYRASVLAIDLIMAKFDNLKVLQNEDILDQTERRRLYLARGQYLERVEFLLKSGSDDAISVYKNGYFDIRYHWKGQRADEGFIGIPQNVDRPMPISPGYEKCFWMMRSLIGSITNGGYLTEKLYVPKEVWEMSTIKISNVEFKQQTFEILILYLSRLEKYKGETESSIEFLLEFESTIESVKSNLSKKLSNVVQRPKETKTSPGRTVGTLSSSSSTSSIPTTSQSTSIFTSISTKLSKSMEKLSIKSHPSYDVTDYVSHACRFFKSAMFLEHWIQKSGPYFNDRLIQIVMFFKTSILVFFLHDFELLHSRYLKKVKSVLYQ